MKPIYIPENIHGVPKGYYQWRDLVWLLRRFHRNALAIHFIADMME